MESPTLAELRRARIDAVLDRRIQSVVVVVEAVRRRHNTSAILRTAEAFGLHEVHLVTGGFHPSRGAARGAERWLDLHRHDTTRGCLEALKARGFQVWVADPTDEAVLPAQIPVDGPVALLFGSELVGVSDEARALADGTVALPMRGLTASLNVSSAAACLILDVAERRRAVVGGGDLDEDRKAASRTRWDEREEASRQGRLARARLGEEESSEDL